MLRKMIGRFFGRMDPRLQLLHSMPKQAICAEIGCWKGDFSKLILDICQPARLHLIDPYKHVDEYEDSWYGGAKISQGDLDKIHTSVVNRFWEFIDRGQVICNRRDSSEAAKSFVDCYFDWIYIDGDHTYSAVLEDLNKYLPKVKAGGYICGDDYGVRGWWDDGVKKAFDFFTARNPERVALVEIIGSQIILEKIKN